MIYLVTGHSMLYVAMLIDKTLGKGQYDVIRTGSEKLRKCRIFLVDGFCAYKRKERALNSLHKKAIFIFDTPFKVEGDIDIVDMDITDLISKYEPKDFILPDLKDRKKTDIKIDTLNASTIKAVEFFTVSSVIDKVNTFVYRCSSNRTRPKIRKTIFDYVLGQISKEQVLETYEKDMRRQTLEKGIDILNSIFEWMESDKGVEFREVVKLCKGKTQDEIKSITDETGVDRFDINTVLLNA